MATNPGVSPTGTGSPCTVGMASDATGVGRGTTGPGVGWAGVVVGGGGSACCDDGVAGVDSPVAVGLDGPAEPDDSPVAGAPAGRPDPATVSVVGLTQTATAMTAATANTAASTVKTVRRRVRRRRRIIGSGPE